MISLDNIALAWLAIINGVAFIMYGVPLFFLAQVVVCLYVFR